MWRFRSGRMSIWCIDIAASEGPFGENPIQQLIWLQSGNLAGIAMDNTNCRGIP